MSIAAFALAEPAIAEVIGTPRGKRPPPQRVIVAKADSRTIPEPR